MMKKVFLSLLLMLSIILIALLIRPHLMDERKLNFEVPAKFTGRINPDNPDLIELDSWVYSAFCRMNSDDPVEVNEDYFENIERVLRCPTYFEFTACLSLIEYAANQNAEVPARLLDRTYLRSKFGDSLKNEVYFIKLAIDEVGPSPYWLIMSEPYDWKTITKFWFTQVFTFQPNKTLNKYWGIVEQFNSQNLNCLPLNDDWREYNIDNYYGDLLILISAPSVEGVGTWITNFPRKIEYPNQNTHSITASGGSE